MLARMRPVVSRPARSLAARSLAASSPVVGSRAPAHRARPLGLVCVVAILAAACGGGIQAPHVDTPQGRGFIPLVPDSIDDVGLAPSVAVDGQGLPVISYFGFPAQLAEGDIPVARPVGSPFLTTEDGDDAGAVLLASLTPDQIWTRGAIAQPRETPAGVPVPFGPAAEASLASLTPKRAAGTDIAIAGSDMHATWASNEGVFYGLGPDPFEIAQVEATHGAGAPSIVLDGAGSPLIAYTVAATHPEVRVAERAGEEWKSTTVATLDRCGLRCPAGTQIGLVGDDPLVVVADPLTGEVRAAQRQGGAWSSEVVATGATGGASLATDGDTAAIAFYTPSGVAVATGRFGSWSIADVAPFAEAGGSQKTEVTVPTPPSTSVAIDSKGSMWVAWQDPEGIHLASSGDGGFAEVELPDTSGGVNPSLAVTDDGSSVYLAWYDSSEGDLRLGTYGEIEDLLIAAPPPLPSPPAQSNEGCGDDGKVVLDIVAQGTAFDPTCLVAPAGEPFTITFDDKDPVATTGQHNIAIAVDEESVAQDPIFRGDLVSGPDTVEYPVPAMEEGSYFFHCDIHFNMTGTLAVVASGGGGGNGGGG
jgi:plastocyanin